MLADVAAIARDTVYETWSVRFHTSADDLGWDARPDLHDPDLDQLVENGGASAATLRAYLAAGGDVARTAAALDVHRPPFVTGCVGSLSSST